MNPDFIGVVDGALPSNICKEIIKYIDGKQLVQGGYGDGQIDLNYKDVQEVRPVPFLDDGSIVSEHLTKSLNIFTSSYRNLHPGIDEICSWAPLNYYTLKKYDPGQGYHAVHCENSGMSNNINRMLVWMFYFNTVTDAGGTFFPEYDRIVNAVEGRLVIWPAYWTHIHKGIVSETQTKYIASGWYGFINE